MKNLLKNTIKFNETNKIKEIESVSPNKCNKSKTNKHNKRQANKQIKKLAALFSQSPKFKFSQEISIIVVNFWGFFFAPYFPLELPSLT